MNRIQRSRKKTNTPTQRDTAAQGYLFEISVPKTPKRITPQQRVQALHLQIRQECGADMGKIKARLDFVKNRLDSIPKGKQKRQTTVLQIERDILLQLKVDLENRR